MYITPLYAALLSLVFVVLSFRVILLRQKLEVGIGDGGDKRLLRATRVHGNFAEYVPLALLLLFLPECQTKTTLWVHIGGSVLLAGRLLHAYGVSQGRWMAWMPKYQSHSRGDRRKTSGNRK